MADNQVDELGGSELGTKAFWESVYANDFLEYQQRGDVGEIWFEEDSQNRVIDWIGRQDGKIGLTDNIIDLGCGNGMMLIELARLGYSQLTGIDYSPKAIQLATEICKDQEQNIAYRVVDLVSADEVTALGQFKVVHDKGTYDAISLHPDNPKVARGRYIDSVQRLLHQDGLFILTSCNWTQSELELSFGEHFTLHAVIPTPTFKFDGKVGNVFTSVVFVKKAST